VFIKGLEEGEEDRQGLYFKMEMDLIGLYWLPWWLPDIKNTHKERIWPSNVEVRSSSHKA